MAPALHLQRASGRTASCCKLSSEPAFPFGVGFQESFLVNAFAFMRIAKEGNSEDEMSPSGDSWPLSMGRAPEAGSQVGFLQLSIPDHLLLPLHPVVSYGPRLQICNPLNLYKMGLELVNKAMPPAASPKKSDFERLLGSEDTHSWFRRRRWEESR